MNAKLITSSLDVLIENLHTNKHYCEYRMSKKGLTRGAGKYYDPTELTIVSIYSFEEAAYPGEFSFVYILKDNNEVLGYSKDLFSEYSINEENLYHWFITKITRELTSH